MLDYGKIVKEEYKPKVDEAKKTEILKLLEKEEMKLRKVVKKYRPVVDADGVDVGVESFYEEQKEKDRYQEGNKFMNQGNLKRKKVVSLSVDASAISQKSD